MYSLSLGRKRGPQGQAQAITRSEETATAAALLDASWIVHAGWRTFPAAGRRVLQHLEAFPRHETCAFLGMHNPRSDSILEHALEVVELCRPVVEVIQRRDRDLASQLRRAVSSVVLNLAEGFGLAGGHARVRFETAHGSLHETRAGLRVAVAWGYVSGTACTEVLKSLDALGARVFGLVRR